MTINTLYNTKEDIRDREQALFWFINNIWAQGAIISDNYDNESYVAWTILKKEKIPEYLQTLPTPENSTPEARKFYRKVTGVIHTEDELLQTLHNSKKTDQLIRLLTIQKVELLFCLLSEEEQKDWLTSY